MTLKKGCSGGSVPGLPSSVETARHFLRHNWFGQAGTGFGLIRLPVPTGAIASDRGAEVFLAIGMLLGTILCCSSHNEPTCSAADPGSAVVRCPEDVTPPALDRSPPAADIPPSCSTTTMINVSLLRWSDRAKKTMFDIRRSSAGFRYYGLNRMASALSGNGFDT